MNKTDSLQEQMGNTGKEVEILWKNQKEMLRIKNTVKQKLRMFLMNLVDWTQLKKEILGLGGGVGEMPRTLDRKKAEGTGSA